ncbi:poly-gamma-glutamate hydrolase family protein [Streptomyces sp. NPDC057002]|uniref:poly-gamma-glutamate hydrolase family protein n=1 Tax=Streptomyces sp. NPDC057002 TaxID=3345992 RepID=UPI00363C398A
MAYPYYRALAAAKTLGIDYDIKNTYGVGDYLGHIAIHGGAIEPPTSQLAQYCADGGAYYSFEALSDLTAPDLALPPTTFDEPFCLVNVGNSARTISWRGVEDQREAEEVTYVSGLDDVLVSLVIQELNASGFVTDTPPLRFEGSDPQNITNKNKLRAGVQLDLTRSLRKTFYSAGDLSATSVTNPENRLPAFFTYGDAINRAAALVPLTVEQPETPPVIQATGPVDTAVSVAMRTPFAIDHTGGVASTTEPREQLLDRIHALVGTLPGERVMRATYGVPTSAALFEENADVANDQLQRGVLDAVAQWEPSAVVSAIVATVNSEVGMVDINVQVSRSDVPGAEQDNTRTIGVLVGGTVVSTPG